jgi:hypothetical protein
MEYDPKDNEVIHLLKKLKDSNGAYPPEMLAVRRQGYLRQVAEVSAGVGLALALRNVAKGGKGTAGLSSTAGTIVEALLVVALVAEAGVVTYFNQDKVAEFFRSFTHSPRAEQVASPPVFSSPIREIQVTPSLVATVVTTETNTLIPQSPTATLSSTPPQVLAAATAQPKGAGGTSAQSASTSAPGSNTGGSSSSSQGSQGNNGNHYGQTPKPERTKEPGRNSSSTQETSKKKKP